MASPATLTSTPPEAQPTMPPLENGDRLTRAEFERRYAAMPQLKKAELIEGIGWADQEPRLSWPLAGHHGSGERPIR